MNIADVSPEADTALLAEAKALRDGVHLLCAMAAANDDSALRASVIDQSAGYLYSFMYNLFAGTLVLQRDATTLLWEGRRSRALGGVDQGGACERRGMVAGRAGCSARSAWRKRRRRWE
jgi:hypothetical protein